MKTVHPDENDSQITLTLLLLALMFMFLPGCTTGEETAQPAEEESAMSIELTSPAFAHGEAIPTLYSCDGDDISPPLQWQNVPAGTQSLALIMDDPDAPRGTWVHWVLYNMPPQTSELPENVALTAGSSQGTNSWNRLGYGGPCPPSGTHRYFFKLYALDSELDLAAGATKDQLLAAMEGHILAQGELMGTYARR
jgi:Raf kinase inhibitor-like YbhB/YbcL family protein